MPTSENRRVAAVAVAGLALVLVGVLGYFAVLFVGHGRFAWVRNDAYPNWAAVGLGVVVGALAVARGRGRRWPRVALVADVGLAAAFAAFLYWMPAVPLASAPALGSRAPEFAVVDDQNKPVRLADVRGSPLLLVFYRGHW